MVCGACAISPRLRIAQFSYVTKPTRCIKSPVHLFKPSEMSLEPLEGWEVGREQEMGDFLAEAQLKGDIHE